MCGCHNLTAETGKNSNINKIRTKAYNISHPIIYQDSSEWLVGISVEFAKRHFYRDILIVQFKISVKNSNRLYISALIKCNF